MAVLETGGCGAAVNDAVGLSFTSITKGAVVSVLLQVDVSVAINLTEY